VGRPPAGGAPLPARASLTALCYDFVVARALSGIRLASAIAALCAGAVACSALVGIEDVKLRDGRLDAGLEEELDAPTGPTDSGLVLVNDGGADAQVQLALGFNHTCARKLDGTLLCWGENGAGQLGDGKPFDGGMVNALAPQKVTGVSDAIDVAAGVSHTCAIKRDRSVACWGLNLFGQLGDGTKQRTSSPVAVLGLNNAVMLAGGTSFTCALRESGKVACWGANYSGQLGDGTKTDRSTMADVSQLTGVTTIAAAEHHACAVVAGGQVRCWGRNTDGQLGNGSTTESLLPAPVGSLTDVVQVVAASRFTCARQSSGQVYCWGANNLGQLGTGSPNAAPNPSPALTVIKDAIHIWVGYEHGCAARASGEAVCWGSAGNGQIGSGTVPEDASIPSPTGVVGVSEALAVATGGDHSCATTVSGAVFCWGSNSLGQVGNGTTSRAYAAVKIAGFP